MKNFADWFYWKGTILVSIFYLTIVPAMAVFGHGAWDWIALGFASLLVPWFGWMRHYEKGYKRKYLK